MTCSEAVDKQVRRLDELCLDAAVALAVWLASAGKRALHWSAGYTIQSFPALSPRLERLKTDINALRDAPFSLILMVVSVKSLYGDYDTPQDFLEAFDALVQHAPNAQPALQA